MNRIETKKCIAEILKDNQGSHEFEKVAKLIMKKIGWTHLNRIKQGIADLVGGFTAMRSTDIDLDVSAEHQMMKERDGNE